MKVFLHLLISNLKYNKLELGISYSITIVVLLLFNLFNGAKDTTGDFFFSIAFYAMLYAFYTNRKKYNLKYMISLPLSKSQLIMAKVTSDFVYFIPSIILAFAGVMYGPGGFSTIPLLFILFQIVTFVAFIIFDSDVEQPRLENAKSSFLNRLIYLRKASDFLFFGIFITYCALAVKLTPLDMSTKQYFIILILFLALGFKFHRSLKLLKDENLSYFFPKRDFILIGKKILIFGIIGIVFIFVGAKMPSQYGKGEIYSQIEKSDGEKYKFWLDKVNSLDKNKEGFNPLSASIHAGRLDIVKSLMKRGFKVDENSSYKTKKDIWAPIHLAIVSGNIKLIDFLDKQASSVLEEKTKKMLRTPLQLAAIECKPDVLDYLVSQNVDLNVQDIKGNTALIHSVVKKCFSSMAILLEAGANPIIKNNHNKAASNYTKNKSYTYLLKRREKVIESKVSRGLASPDKLPLKTE